MKKTFINQLLISALLSFYFLSCEKEEVVKYVEVEKVKGKVVVSETNVEIGQKIYAYFRNIDSVKIYSVLLNEKKVTYKQINDTTVALIIPYSGAGYDIGNFVFQGYILGENYKDTVLVSNQVRYRYENWGSTIFTKWNEHEKVTQYESLKSDGFGQKGWKVETNKDTIKVIRNYLCHDECGIKETLVFLNQTNNNLPKFLYAQFNRTEWMKAPIQIKVDKICKLMIDSWDGTTYSGTFSSSDYSWAFWVKK